MNHSSTLMHQSSTIYWQSPTVSLATSIPTLNNQSSHINPQLSTTNSHTLLVVSQELNAADCGLHVAGCKWSVRLQTDSDKVLMIGEQWLSVDDWWLCAWLMRIVEDYWVIGDCWLLSVDWLMTVDSSHRLRLTVSEYWWLLVVTGVSPLLIVDCWPMIGLMPVVTTYDCDGWLCRFDCC